MNIFEKKDNVSDQPADPSRREFLKKMAVFGVGALAGLDLLSGKEAVAMTEEEKRNTEAFFNEKMAPVIVQIINQQHATPEINQRFLEIAKKLKATFPQNQQALALQIVPGQKSEIRNAPGASGLINGMPTIGLYVGFWREIEKELERSFGPEAPAVFRTTVAINFMHESEHLAQLKPGMENKNATVNEEIIAWANTCQYTIEPLVKQGKKIANSQRLFYQAWSMAGRNVKNQAWIDYIKSTYKSLPGYEK
jgi:hypothetical protein